MERTPEGLRCTSQASNVLSLVWHWAASTGRAAAALRVGGHAAAAASPYCSVLARADASRAEPSQVGMAELRRVRPSRGGSRMSWFAMFKPVQTLMSNELPRVYVVSLTTG